MNRTSLAAGILFALFVAGFVSLGSRGWFIGPDVAVAQNLGYRVVFGNVLDSDSNPVVGATVFLKDLKSKDIRTYTTVEKGRFRFAGVKMAEEHELWAEMNGKKTAVKTISHWETRKEYEVELKLK